MMTAFTALATILFLLEAGNAAHQWNSGTMNGGTVAIYLAFGLFGIYALIVGK